MDKSILEWQKRFQGMSPESVNRVWSDKAANDVSWIQESNFHAAAAERMKQLGNMAIDLDDASRKKLCRQANDILNRLQAYLRDSPEKMQAIKNISNESDAYYAKFGTKTARYYMYEQGVIDELGDRKRG